MKCSYVRQTSEFSKFKYFDHPDMFDSVSENAPCYKNIIFLTEPNDDEKDFYVHSVGYEKSDTKKNLVNRIFPTRIALHYIVDGEGSFNGHHVKKGDCFVLFPNTPHSICTNPNNTLQFYWIMLRVPEAFNASPWGFEKNQEIFQYSYTKEMQRIFDEMLHFYSDYQNPHYFFLSKFYELISYHKSNIATQSAYSKELVYSHYVSLAKRMWEQTNYTLSVEEVARSMGFSRKYFSAFFIAEVGVSPREYVLNHKIDIAKIKMDAGETNLQLLSAQLGYGDYPSFSRAFKRITGIGPKMYLEQVRLSKNDYEKNT